MKKVIIIGAGRSGTKILRDTLLKFPDFVSWDCDEINPIWRHGNLRKNHDELTVDDATPEASNYINKQFHKLSKKNNGRDIVEKTCANSLRVPFVYQAIPDAKYIFIIRDGRDVVASAMKRWRSGLEFRYTVKKMKYIPPSDIFYYFSKFGVNRIKQLFKADSQLSFWGPAYNGMQEDVKSNSLIEVCTKQWEVCVEKSLSGLKHIPDDQQLTIKYEEFVTKTEAVLNQLSEFLKVSAPINSELLAGPIRTDSIGKYKKELSEREINYIEDKTSSLLQRLEYCS